MIADFTAVTGAGDGPTVARRLVQEAGVATIPLSPFYAQGGASNGLQRLCFAKPDSLLIEAAARLGQWKVRQAVVKTMP